MEMPVDLTSCLNCSGEMLPGDYSKIVIFFCGHMVHQNCSSKRNGVSSNNKFKLLVTKLHF